MLERVIKIFGEYEPIYIFITDAGYKWTISHSRWYTFGVRVLGMDFDKMGYPSAASCISAYIKFCESYYSI